MSRNPNVNDLLNPLHFLSLGFGSGLLKPGPGTWGTLAALPVWWFCLAELSWRSYVLIILVSFAIGVFLCGYTAKALEAHDHGAIVWDEFVGVWIALALLPKIWIALLLGFVFFRVFDIFKPYPIKLLDKHVHGGFGIMIDDVLAGIFAWICVKLCFFGWFFFAASTRGV